MSPPAPPSAPPRADGVAPLRVYVMDVSYFSGKLEAYLRYKGIPHERVEVGWRELGTRIRRHTGQARVPVVETSDGVWLQDSTPLIDWLEARFPDAPVIPDDPVQAWASRLLEDYADEWLWRPALYYRWSQRADARLLGDRIAREVMKDVPGPRWLHARLVRGRQRRVYVAGDGVDRTTRAHVEAVYFGALARLERVLAARPYLLGGRPSLADFGFFASMFRHFSLDPTPARTMRDAAPAVYAWVARLWNARAFRDDGAGLPGDDAAWHAPGSLPDGWRELLADAGACYLPYLHANARAFARGERRFDFPVQGVTYRNLPVVVYRVWCRERLQQHFDALPASGRPAVQALLEECGAWEPLWRDGRIASHLHEGAGPPVCAPRRRARGWLARDPWNPVRGAA